MGENKESRPRTGDIDEVGHVTSQDIVVHKRFPNICGQDFQMYYTITQGPASDH